MIDLKEKEALPVIQVEIEQRPDKTLICYTGSEEGFYNVAAAIRSLPLPRNPTADMMVRIIAILSTLVGALYLSYGFFTVPLYGETHAINRDRPLQTR
jgi:hypothetical protein